MMGTEDTCTGSLSVEICFPELTQARSVLESLEFKATLSRSGLMEYDDIFKSSTGVTARFIPNTDGTIRVRLRTHEPSNEHDREKLGNAAQALVQEGGIATMQADPPQS